MMKCMRIHKSFLRKNSQSIIKYSFFDLQSLFFLSVLKLFSFLPMRCSFSDQGLFPCGSSLGQSWIKLWALIARRAGNECPNNQKKLGTHFR